MIAGVRNSSVLRAAEAALVDELVAPLLDLVGVTFDVVADEWLAWGVRDRDWKPSTLSDNRSNSNAGRSPRSVVGQRARPPAVEVLAEIGAVAPALRQEPARPP